METVRLSDKLELTRVIVGCMRMMDAGKKGKDLLRFVTIFIFSRMPGSAFTTSSPKVFSQRFPP